MARALKFAARYVRDITDPHATLITDRIEVQKIREAVGPRRAKDFNAFFVGTIGGEYTYIYGLNGGGTVPYNDLPVTPLWLDGQRVRHIDDVLAGATHLERLEKALGDAIEAGNTPSDIALATVRAIGTRGILEGLERHYSTVLERWPNDKDVQRVTGKDLQALREYARSIYGDTSPLQK